ncbi:MAG: hypothetical protein ABJB01_05955 [Rudaea sp.]
MRLNPWIIALSFVAIASTSTAAETQSFTATIDGAKFISDDDSILLVPLKSSFSLSAATQGASAYPPPKTPIDRISIMCKVEMQPVKLSRADMSDGTCEATLTKGSDKSAGEYSLDKQNADNALEITAVKGKTMDGTFRFHMKNKAGASAVIADGKFRAEDRQL